MIKEKIPMQKEDIETSALIRAESGSSGKYEGLKKEVKEVLEGNRDKEDLRSGNLMDYAKLLSLDDDFLEIFNSEVDEGPKASLNRSELGKGVDFMEVVDFLFENDNGDNTKILLRQVETLAISEEEKIDLYKKFMVKRIADGVGMESVKQYVPEEIFEKITAGGTDNLDDEVRIYKNQKERMLLSSKSTIEGMERKYSFPKNKIDSIPDGDKIILKNKFKDGGLIDPRMQDFETLKDINQATEKDSLQNDIIIKKQAGIIEKEIEPENKKIMFILFNEYIDSGYSKDKFEPVVEAVSRYLTLSKYIEARPSYQLMVAETLSYLVKNEKYDEFKSFVDNKELQKLGWVDKIGSDDKYAIIEYYVSNNQIGVAKELVALWLDKRDFSESCLDNALVVEFLVGMYRNRHSFEEINTELNYYIDKYDDYAIENEQYVNLTMIAENKRSLKWKAHYELLSAMKEKGE